MRKVIPANSAFQKYLNCAEARDKLGNLSKSSEIKYLWVLTQYKVAWNKSLKNWSRFCFCTFAWGSSMVTAYVWDHNSFSLILL